jgi:hypothetical protein
MTQVKLFGFIWLNMCCVPAITGFVIVPENQIWTGRSYPFRDELLKESVSIFPGRLTVPHFSADEGNGSARRVGNPCSLRNKFRYSSY